MGMNNTPSKQPATNTPKKQAGKNKQTIVILVAVGGLVVLSVLIIGGIAIFGGGDETQTTTEDTASDQASENTTETEAAEPAETESDDSNGADGAATEAAGQDAADSTPAEADQAADAQSAESSQQINPSHLFFGLVRSVQVDEAQVEPEIDPPDDPVAVRQLMVEHLESQGLSEDDLADFFAAYDASTSEALQEKLATWTAEEILALESAVGAASEPALEGVLLCLEPLLTAAFAAAADPELAENPTLLEESLKEEVEAATGCVIDALNALGRQILAALEANELL